MAMQYGIQLVRIDLKFWLIITTLSVNYAATNSIHKNKSLEYIASSFKTVWHMFFNNVFHRAYLYNTYYAACEETNSSGYIERSLLFL